MQDEGDGAAEPPNGNRGGARRASGGVAIGSRGPVTSPGTPPRRPHPHRMDHSATFARHFARLVWLLVDDPANTDEQKGRSARSRPSRGRARWRSGATATPSSPTAIRCPRSWPACPSSPRGWVRSAPRAIDVDRGATAGDIFRLARRLAAAGADAVAAIPADATARFGDGSPAVAPGAIHVAARGQRGGRVVGARPRRGARRAGHRRARALHPAHGRSGRPRAATPPQRERRNVRPLRLARVGGGARRPARPPRDRVRPRGGGRAARRSRRPRRAGPPERARVGGRNPVRIVGREPRCQDLETKRAIGMPSVAWPSPRCCAPSPADGAQPERADCVAVLARAGEDGADASSSSIAAPGAPARPARVLRRAACAQGGRAGAPPHAQRPRWFAVRNAAELLGEMQVSEAEQPLLGLLLHDDERVRRAATAR